jgi:type II secretory pathway pseudopilin PulG
MRKKTRNEKRRGGERGFSLIETVIAIAVAFIGTVIALQFLMVRTGSVLLVERQQQAEESAEGALGVLAARSSRDLPDTGATFELQADGTLRSNRSCWSGICDQIVDGPSASHDSPAGGVMYGPPPSGTTRTFVRRWRVETIDAARQQRRITVAVLSTDASTYPLAVRSVDTFVKAN